MEKYQFPKIKNETVFEDFIRDLLNLIHADTSFQLYGRKGQSQNGLDGYSTLHNIFFQCKHKSSQYLKDSKLEEELVEELNKAKSKILQFSNSTISKFLFFTTHPNTTKLQDKAKSLSSDEITVEYWGWESIESYLNDFYLFENKHFYKKYYPELASGLSSSSILSQLTTKLGKESIIGRKKELQEIETCFNDSKALLIHGIGGMGKSTLVSHYFYVQKEKFDYYGFFEGLDDFVNKLEIALKLKIEQGQDRLSVVLHELIKLDGTKLLVIDDIKEVEENQKLVEKILDLKQHDGFKILLTSREEIVGVESYVLDTLSMNDAKELFNSICKVEDEVLLEEILNYLDCHAFFVEKVAQTLKNKKGLWKLEDIKKKFDNPEFPEIRVKKRESFNKLLKELFTLNQLEEDEVLLLKQLSVLPSIDIEFEFLSQIFQVDDVIGFQEDLDYLNEKGWLIYADGSYKLHQIIKEFMLLPKNAPTLQDIEEVFVYFFKLIENSSIIRTVSLNRDKLMFFESIYRILKEIDINYDVSQYIAIFYMNLGNIYRGLSSYKKALFFGKLSIKILNSIVKENTYNEEELTAYNNLSQTYYALGLYKRTYVLDKKVLNLRKEILGNNHIHTIQAYHNLAQLTFNCGNNKEAKKLFEEAINLIREVHIENLNMFISEKTYLYSNYASFLLTTEPNNKLSLEFANEAVNIYKKEYGNSNAHFATLYHNLINIQEHFGEDLNRVIESRENVLQLKINSFGEDHEDVATAYTELAVAYARSNNCKVACNYINRALIIYMKIFQKENHPRIIDCNDRLNYIESICKKDK